MEIRPILSALMRSKVAMILIGLQVALTLAIVCNALFIIGQRLDHMARPSGMNESDTFWFGSNGFGQGYNAKVVQQSDLALLRQLPGVADAAPTNSVPMSDGGWSAGLSLQPHQKKSTAETTIYLVDDHAIEHVRLEARRRPQFQARRDQIARISATVCCRRSRSSRRRSPTRCSRTATRSASRSTSIWIRRRRRSSASSSACSSRGCRATPSSTRRSCRRSCRTATRRAISCAPNRAGATSS